MKKKIDFKFIIAILIAVGGLGYFGYSFIKPIKQQPIPIAKQQVLQISPKDSFLRKEVETTASPNPDVVKEWGEVIFYFLEKGLALTATGVGVYLSIKQINKKKA